MMMVDVARELVQVDETHRFFLSACWHVRIGQGLQLRVCFDDLPVASNHGVLTVSCRS